MTYRLLNDYSGKPYYGVVLSNSSISLNSSFFGIDFSTFNRRFLQVEQRVSTPFSRYLTSDHENVIIAFISLFLLLIIEGFVGTISLRTTQSQVQTFSFSVKLVLELIRDLRFEALSHHSHVTRGRVRRLPKRLILSAVAVQCLVFGLEAVILILTMPRPRPLRNTQATLRVLRPFFSKWKNVHFTFRKYLDRPCTGMQIVGAMQKSTRITACVTTNLTGLELQLFERLEKNASDVPLSIVTYVHDYGMDHVLTIGNLTAEYAARAYFTLDDDEGPRLMSAINPKAEHEAEQVAMMHKLYIGYLFTIYWRATDDEKVTVEYLNSLQRNFSGPAVGRDVYLTDINGRASFTRSTKYVTTSIGRFPRGSPALRVADNTFRTSLGVRVTHEGNTTDLFVGKGVKTVKGVLWYEKARALNWLSLSVVTVLAFGLLVVLRLMLQPAAFADVAATLVKERVKADMGRGPLELAKDEEDKCRLYGGIPGLSLGAETGQRISYEYHMNGSAVRIESVTRSRR